MRRIPQIEEHEMMAGLAPARTSLIRFVAGGKNQVGSFLPAYAMPPDA